MSKLAGKVAIVTGGAQGQGAAISRAFLEEGAKVVIADVADEPGELLAKELGQLPGGEGNVVFRHHDVSDEASWTRLVAETNELFGPVSVLANNAGILRFGEIATGDLTDVQLMWQVNQMGVFLGMRAVVPTMQAHGGGSIINASSVEGLAGMANCTGYAATKWAIRGMTKCAAMELGRHGIRVNSVHPGMID